MGCPNMSGRRKPNPGESYGELVFPALPEQADLPARSALQGPPEELVIRETRVLLGLGVILAQQELLVLLGFRGLLALRPHQVLLGRLAPLE